jgi:hypothetical protein
MQSYDREIYSRQFARLLNKALKAGQGDAQAALTWLENSNRPMLTMLFDKHPLEMTDAYLDAREHLQRRLDEKETEI